MTKQEKTYCENVLHPNHVDQLIVHENRILFLIKNNVENEFYYSVKINCGRWTKRQYVALEL